MLEAKNKQQNVKIGDWIVLTDLVFNGEIACVTDILSNGYIEFDGGVTNSFKVFDGEFVTIPKTEYERLKAVEEQKRINDQLNEMSRQIQRDTLLHGLELLRQRKQIIK